MIEKFIQQCNEWGRLNKPFFFLIDFELNKPLAIPMDDLEANHIFLDFHAQTKGQAHQEVFLTKHPMEKQDYVRAFDFVQDEMKRGNSFLVNLTFPTPVDSSMSLAEIMNLSRAPYKLLFKNEFVCFSPECFIRIENNVIHTYPMKGTIDASVKDAEKQILENKKELWEHYTIVDLLRNDLSMVAEQVRVKRFRYLEYIKSKQTQLIQVSSEIEACLKPGWEAELGTLLWRLLPAGSVSGAPKRKTLEIIREAEQQDRGYYTGVFGVFDGKNLDSAVAIRYIENTEKQGLQFRSGGGITIHSMADLEYDELIKKIHVPTV